MINDTKAILMGTLFILLFGMISSAVIGGARDGAGISEASLGSWACTADAKICPDGSTVGRTPPYCQFAPCP